MTTLSAKQKKALILMRIYGEALLFKKHVGVIMSTHEDALLRDTCKMLFDGMDSIITDVRLQLNTAAVGCAQTTVFEIDDIVKNFSSISMAILKISDGFEDLEKITIDEWWAQLTIEKESLINKLYADIGFPPNQQKDGIDIDLANPALDGDADDDEPTIPGASAPAWTAHQLKVNRVNREPTSAESNLHDQICNVNPTTVERDEALNEAHEAFHDGDFGKFNQICTALGFSVLDTDNDASIPADESVAQSNLSSN